ncbi:MAG: T9SS type A sorting domain-containing protein, partial [Flavobacteriales bacterium]
MKKLQTFTLLLVVPFLSFAQPGTLDLGFDADGIATLDVLGETRAESVAIQPDGKIVFCGSTDDPAVPGEEDVYVARLYPDGSLDNTFGSNGVATVLRPGVETVSDMVIQADGKIVLGGTVTEGANDYYYLVRLNTDGSLDLNFGSLGKLVHQVDPMSFSDRIAEIDIQPDGKILVVGTTRISGYDLSVVRFNSNGSIDNTFSFDGTVIIDVNSNDWAAGFYLHDNGQITVACNDNSSGHGFFLARYNADGTLDPAFGVNGIAPMDFSSSFQHVEDITVTQEGDILLLVQGGTMSNSDVWIVRLLEDGTLDNSFSFDGVAEFDVAPHDYPSQFLIQPDGKILVVGQTENTWYYATLFRFNGDGTIDNTFGVNGHVLASLGANGNLRSVTLQEDGKIVTCGVSYGDAAVARYLSGINIGIGEVDAYIGSTLVYPNPITNNSITVEYELKSDETVSIELYDLAGKQIARLQSSTKEKVGSYQKTLSLPTLS